MVPICSHCPNCSTQWSLVVLTAVPNAPICSTQLSPLQRPIVPTAVPKASICSAQWSQLQCPIAHHLHCPMLQFEVPYGPNCSAKPSAVPNGTMASVVHIRVTLGQLRVTIQRKRS